MVRRASGIGPIRDRKSIQTLCAVMCALVGAALPPSELALGGQTPGPYGVVHDEWDWLELGLSFRGVEVTATLDSVVLQVDCIGPTDQLLAWSDSDNWNDVVIPLVRVQQITDFVSDPGGSTSYDINLGDLTPTPHVPFEDFMAMGPTETQASLPIPLNEYGIPGTINLALKINYDVTIGGNRDVVLNQDSTLNSLTVQADGWLYVEPTRTLVLKQQSTNDGEMSVDGAISIQGSFLNQGTLAFGGTDYKGIEPASTLVNTGTIRQQGNSLVELHGIQYTSGAQDSGVIDNRAGAVYDLTGDGNIGTNSPIATRVDNAGLFLKSGGTGESVVWPPFNNTGTVEVDSGTLTLNAGGEFANATTLVQEGASLRLAQGTLTTVSADSAFNGSGTVEVKGGLELGEAVTVQGSAPIVVNGGWLRGAGADSLFGSDTDVRFQSGAVGEGGVAVAGSFLWTGGRIGGTLFNLGDGFQISGTDYKGIEPASTLVNTGTIRQQGNSLVELHGIQYTSGAQDSGVIDNRAGAVYDLTDDGNIGTNSPIATRVDNAGLFLKSGGTGESVIWPAFNNTGTIEVDSGTLAFEGRFTQTAGSTRLSGGSISSTTPLNVKGGSIEGNGMILASVLNEGGTIRPGFSPGALAVDGDYTQELEATLLIEMAGVQPGEFDVLNVTGTATLDGLLEVSFLGTFRPAVGDMFTVLTYGSHVGEFDSVFVTGLPSFHFASDYDIGALTLRLDSTQAVPLPPSAWLAAAGLLSSLGCLVRREAKVERATVKPVHFTSPTEDMHSP